MTAEPRCESCGRRRETLTVVFGPLAGRVLDVAETRFEVCRLCADAADASGYVLVEVER